MTDSSSFLNKWAHRDPTLNTGCQDSWWYWLDYDPASTTGCAGSAAACPATGTATTADANKNEEE